MDQEAGVGLRRGGARVKTAAGGPRERGVVIHIYMYLSMYVFR